MTTDIDAIDKPEVVSQLEKTQQAGKLKVKGYSIYNIAEIMNITPHMAEKYVQEYMSLLRYQSEQDPFFLERVQYNTLIALSEIDEISKEAWETVEIASQHGMVTARTQALKLALEIASKRAQLHQLGSGNRTDNEYITRMQRAESVNSQLSNIIRDVVSSCPNCREKARIALAEAFSMINSDAGVMDAEIVEDE